VVADTAAVSMAPAPMPRMRAPAKAPATILRARVRDMFALLVV
jgi:hypothetical protein